MIEVTELRAGTAFELNGEPFLVLKYTHTKMGRGNANIKLRAKSLKTGAMIEKNFVSGAKVNSISLTRQAMQYLYADKDYLYLMDKKSFEQIEVSRTLIKEGAGFLKEGMEVGVLFWDEKPLLVEAPNFAEFEVVDTGPAVRGNSATNIFKEAVLENKVKIKVPLFIKVGDKVKVDTRDGSYAERVK